MIYGLLCTKNEADRYLDACLEWHKQFLDAIMVFDDHSTDDTVKLAQSHGAHVILRPDEVPTFMEHEGEFRQASLDALQGRFNLKTGDWVLVFDADEFLTGPTDKIGDFAWQADIHGAKSMRLQRPEVWGAEEIEGWYINPVVRSDGLWNRMTCTRMFRWEPNGEIEQKAMGCGNEPTYTRNALVFEPPEPFYLVHVGYMKPEDRVTKFERYSSLANHGHNPQHIDSIVGSYEAKNYSGPWPDIWDGARMSRSG